MQEEGRQRIPPLAGIQPAEESGTFKEICKQNRGILFLSKTVTF